MMKRGEGKSHQREQNRQQNGKHQNLQVLFLFKKDKF